jgi:toxin ParE1/3/4
VAQFKIAARAKSDLASILALSEERWGIEGRERYATVVSAALQKIARDPLSPSSRARELVGSQMRSLHLRHAGSRRHVRDPVHVVFYRITKTTIEVVRVLHDRMNPHAHIGHKSRAK